MSKRCVTGSASADGRDDGWLITKDTPMQADDAEALREGWASQGNLPCPHDVREKEFYLDSDTSAEICIVCGKSFWRGN
jgi:hypothetical protein